MILLVNRHRLLAFKKLDNTLSSYDYIFERPVDFYINQMHIYEYVNKYKKDVSILIRNRGDGLSVKFIFRQNQIHVPF